MTGGTEPASSAARSPCGGRGRGHAVLERVLRGLVVQSATGPLRFPNQVLRHNRPPASARTPVRGVEVAGSSAARRSGRRHAPYAERHRLIAVLIAAGEDGWYVEPRATRAASISRRLEQPSVILLVEGRRVPQDAGHELNDRLDDDECRDLTAPEHVVAERGLPGRDSPPLRPALRGRRSLRSASRRRRGAARGRAPRPFTQRWAEELALEPHLVFACGRYEGIDARVAQDAAAGYRVQEPLARPTTCSGAVRSRYSSSWRRSPDSCPACWGTRSRSTRRATWTGCSRRRLHEAAPVARPRRTSRAHLRRPRRDRRWRRAEALRRTASRRPDLVAALDPAHPRRPRTEPSWPSSRWESDGEPDSAGRKALWQTELSALAPRSRTEVARRPTVPLPRGERTADRAGATDPRTH